MSDRDAFLAILRRWVDNIIKTLPPQAPRQGEAPALSSSEVVMLAIYRQWSRYRSERDFYRFAGERLKGLFPTSPDRSQINRQERLHHDTIVGFFRHLSDPGSFHNRTGRLKSRQRRHEVALRRL